MTNLPVDPEPTHPLWQALASPRGLWGAVGLTSVGLCAWTALLVRDFVDAERPALSAAMNLPPAAARSTATGALSVAGSGSAVAPLREVVAACRRAGQTLDVQFEPAIGSGGGLRALRDGVIDAALVTRTLQAVDLQPTELKVTYAQAPVTFATRRAEGQRFDGRALLAALRADKPSWPDGAPMAWLLREPGDSGHRVLSANNGDFAALEAQARRNPASQVFFHDRTMHAALLGAGDAVGVVDATAVRADGLPLRLLSWGDAASNAAAVATQAWPFVKPHTLVYHANAAQRLRPLLDCLGSAPGVAAFAQLGAAPVQSAR